MRQTAAEKETARHRVDLFICNRQGDVVESHRMQSWDVSTAAGALAGKFRDARGYTPIVRCRFLDGRDAHFLLPRSWQ